MKKLVLSAVSTIAVAGLTYAAKQGMLKPAADKMLPVVDRVKQLPLVARAIDKMSDLRRSASNDDSTLRDAA